MSILADKIKFWQLRTYSVTAVLLYTLLLLILLNQALLDLAQAGAAINVEASLDEKLRFLEAHGPVTARLRSFA